MVYNAFQFNTLEAIVAVLTALFMGIFFGFLLGILRYILFAFMEGKKPNMGREVKL